MIPEECRLIFIGTPEFAVPSLKAIVEAGFRVVGVITVPDKPAGRGMSLTESPVKQFAPQHGLKIMQPTNLKNAEFIEELKSLRADIQVVIAFRMLPEMVWNMPPLGTINLHASLLPDYRGAAPINRAIMNGETKTGLTTFRLQHEIDTGEILMQQEIEILPEDNAGSMHDKMMVEGASLMVKTLKGILDQTIKPKPQIVKPIHHTAPKIFKEDCEIDWNKKGLEILNQIRGLSPYPVARTRFNGKVLKIYEAFFIPGKELTLAAGEHEITENKNLRFVCSDGWIQVNQIQLEGKKRMLVPEFLNGIRN
ncbi:MAG: methionyl-tRNA formyltransferase [Bacteroidetes bacterium]|nr:methionyl-tRNA formyltransferase [Bacteroidota bacterium]